MTMLCMLLLVAAVLAAADFDWLTEAEDLSPAALTVDVQTAPDLNADDRLLYPILFPRDDVESVKLSDLGAVSFRPAADRRAWNQRGRQIPLRTPKVIDVEIEPIEAFFTIAEREMQAYRERFRNSRALIVAQIGAEIPTRVRGLAAANNNRIELDSFESWVNGQVTVRDPQTGETYVVALPFDVNRYETAGTAWNNGAVNAYNEFIAWYRDAVKAAGAAAGVAMTTAVQQAILADAPTVNGSPLPISSLADRISQDVASPFRFYNMDVLPDIDVFTDGGIDTVATNRWPDASKIALVPVDQRVGRTKWAPVGRAMDLAEEIPEAKIDVNGMAVFFEVVNGGRGLTTECQANVFPMPNEKRIAVMDTLVG